MVGPKPQAAPVGSGGGDEDEVLGRLAVPLQAVSGPPPPGETWIGDDAAVLVPPVGPLVLTIDATVSGVHADLALVGLDDLGWKALTAAVSDVGAMGARPLQAVVSLSVPEGADLDLLVGGLAAASAEWSCPVVGGDLTGSGAGPDGPVVVSVAVTGGFGAPDGVALLRSGASAGDHLFVTGALGASAAGLRVLRRRAAGGSGTDRPPGGTAGLTGVRGADPDDPDDPDALVAAHRRPRARLAEGWAARLAGAGAAMDISDGLGLDLHRLAAASGVGFALDQVPAAPGATGDEAVGGGEDYELLIATADPDGLRTAFGEAGLRPPVAVGICTADPAQATLAGRPLAPTGFQHRV